jgi:hypothetical protein
MLESICVIRRVRTYVATLLDSVPSLGIDHLVRIMNELCKNAYMVLLHIMTDLRSPKNKNSETRMLTHFGNVCMFLWKNAKKVFHTV